MSGELLVCWDGEVVGHLRRGPFGVEFRYTEEWVRARSSRPLSRSLPVQSAGFAQAATRWFGNLLPEGEVRHLIARKAGCAIDDVWALLAAYGHDLAGAISVRAADVQDGAEGVARPITDQDIREWSIRGAALAQVQGDGVRLSLAGAQEKVPVVTGASVGLETAWAVPPSPLATTHILKFGSRTWPMLPTVEFLTMRLAARLGLAVAQTDIEWLPTPYLVVRRYDRSAGADGVVTRLHQEDFCQAGGLDAQDKYQGVGQPGPPSWKWAAELVRGFSVNPVRDLARLLEWVVFNAVVGNDDGHAKNLSFLYGPEGWALAPIYDLVATVAIPNVSRRLALAIGGQWDASNLALTHWEQQAAELGMRPARIVEEVRRQIQELPGALDRTIDVDFVGTAPSAKNIGVANAWRKAVEKRAKRVGLSLR
jgi:serine/threonine-protein kinase HipA